MTAAIIFVAFVGAIAAAFLLARGPQPLQIRAEGCTQDEAYRALMEAVRRLEAAGEPVARMPRMRMIITRGNQIHDGTDWRQGYTTIEDKWVVCRVAANPPSGRYEVMVHECAHALRWCNLGISVDQHPQHLKGLFVEWRDA